MEKRNTSKEKKKENKKHPYKKWRKKEVSIKTIKQILTVMATCGLVFIISLILGQFGIIVNAGLVLIFIGLLMIIFRIEPK